MPRGLRNLSSQPDEETQPMHIISIACRALEPFPLTLNNISTWNTASLQSNNETDPIHLTPSGLLLVVVVAGCHFLSFFLWLSFLLLLMCLGVDLFLYRWSGLVLKCFHCIIFLSWQSMVP